MSVCARNCKSWTHLLILAVDGEDAVVAAGVGSAAAAAGVATAAAASSLVLMVVARDVEAYRKVRVRSCNGKPR